jgi:phosphoenolpyruvate carboxylase
MRKIPSTMVSQHPDHANIPYWATTAYIRNQDEIGEAHSSFFDLGVSEYKWDWEGKFVDEAVIERLLSEYFEDFKKTPLGKEKFLTFRLPNPKVETEFRLGRAFMGILAAAGLAEKTHLHSPPLFEVILPMTESAAEVIAVQEAFLEVLTLKHPLLKIADATKLQQLEVIPLFEDIDTIMHSDDILQEYINYHVKVFGKKPEYIRPYVARSDPALNAGVVPTVLAIKVALSRYEDLSEKTGVKMFPIIGSASLPFRGGLTPYSVDQFVNEYKGIRTALLQSAFRYDYPLEDVRKAIAELEEKLPMTKTVRIPKEDSQAIAEITPVFAKCYMEVIEGIAEEINAIAGILPKRRERVQHTGLFGYSRGVGTVRLPRAIGFTAALYSLGVPPEFIGTGRALQQIKNKELVEKYYVSFRSEMKRAGRFINRENLVMLAATNKNWKMVQKDIEALEQYLGEDFKPETDEEKKHLEITSKIFKELQHHSVSPLLVEEAAALRHSLG